VHFLRPGKNLKKYGSWAVITGATDGIGKAYAQELARKGLNVFLVSRTESKLKELAEEISSKYKVEARIFALDFSRATPSAFQQLGKTIAGLEVGVLINNVGVSYDHAEFFDQIDDELIANLIKVNVDGTTQMTRVVISGMVERKKGAIVNVGSGAATIAPSDPLYSVYAGTKGYVDHFSRSLYTEMKGKGIDVQLQAPLYVATKMAKIRRASFTVPSTTGFARAGMRYIGFEPRVTPFWVHTIMWGAIARMPEAIFDSIRLGMCLGIRKRALKKKADAAKKQ